MKLLPQTRAQRGTSLIEALVAFCVMALGMLGVMGLQTTLRLNSDIAKQRSEATRIAQEQIERWRAFSTLESAPGKAAYADIADSSAGVSGYTTNTEYTLNTHVRSLADRKEMAVTVSWRDRNGQPQAVVLDSVIAGADPSLSGLLALRPQTELRTARNRHVGIPIEATDLGNGRSAFRPWGANVHWVFDHASGRVTQVCTTLSSQAPGDTRVSGCTTMTGLVIHGVVRFDTDGLVSATDAEDPQGSAALHLEMALMLEGDGTAQAQCFDAPAGQHAVRYACLVSLEHGAHWAGTLNVGLVGHAVSTTADGFRVCRYSADYNGRNGIENIEHPALYTGVSGPLANQNFLIIRGDNECPGDVAADPAHGDFINTNTVQHAPSPA